MQMGSCFFGQEMCSLYLLAATVVTFVVEAAVVTATAVVVVVVVETFVFWIPSMFLSLGWLIESDRDIWGLLWCRMFVNPPASEPFGESFVTTTDGARTRRGLKIAGISLSLVISLNEMRLWVYFFFVLNATLYRFFLSY